MSETVIVVSLQDDENDTWMNQVRAERVKGAPLSKVEKARILAGKRWNGAADWQDERLRPEDQD